LLLRCANRHGLIAGATGTGKTVSVRVLAEGFSAAGVPVFMADIKGDLSGIACTGEPDAKLAERADTVGLTDYAPQAYPVLFWDLDGQRGHPIRTTISEMGPFLLSRLLDLNTTQEGVLNIAFKVADEDGLLLLDLKDLRAVLEWVAEHASELTAGYGNVSKASIGAIQRQLLTLEQQGGDGFFGEPALDIQNLMQTDSAGRGYINLLAAEALMERPRLYATFLLWLLSELFEDLPEVGDLDRPKLVFFFDEAHLLFADAPRALVQKVEQVVRLIRSKGVGVYFISQHPLDIPDSVLGQLSNRVQHALRAFTPRDQAAVRTVAETFRANPQLDVSRTIMELAVGEALVSTLDASGVPGVVQRTWICPPRSRLRPASEDERRKCIDSSPILGRYDEPVDRDSAHEKLKQRAGRAADDAPPDEERPERDAPPRLSTRRSAQPAPVRRGRESVYESMARSAARSIGSAVGRQIIRGVLGSIFKQR
ncbi:MAG: helicase HerA-like domain-containing protein, partial [Gammaproteobacteria bacterium]